MHKYYVPVQPEDVAVGQRVKIVCARINRIFRTECGYIEGVVTETFDGSAPNGYQIDIRNTSQWWRWIPKIDGGEIYVCPV